MFERRYELSLESTLKGLEMRRLYRETGNEIYKILADYYIDSGENMVGPSKLIKKRITDKNIIYPTCKEEK